MFIFAIYGVQIIGGKLARCNDRTYSDKQVNQMNILIDFFFIDVSMNFSTCVMEHFGENYTCQK